MLIQHNHHLHATRLAHAIQARVALTMRGVLTVTDQYGKQIRAPRKLTVG